MKKQNSTVVRTTSSPFKVTAILEDSIQVETSAALNTLGHKSSGIKMSLGNIKQILLLYHNT